MRLDFNVLWVEDQPRGVEAQVTGIRNRMEEEGFEFNPTMCRSLDEVRTRVGDAVFNDQVDLILVDWDLGGQTWGQEVIEEIRDSIRYKEVIFYSGSNNPDALRRLAADAGLEGVYCSIRDTLVDDVVGVFDSLVKKVLDLDHTRGIVMGSTSDIDFMVLECVEALHGRMDEKGQAALIAEAIGLIDERIKEHAEAFEKLRGNPSLAALMKAKSHFTAYDRLRILSRVLASEGFKDHAAARDSVIKYIEDVVPRRNDLGHKMLLPDGKTVAIAVVGGEKHFSEEEMRELRRLILSLRAEFRTLRDKLRQ